MRTLKAAVSLILAVGCFCINLLPFSYAEFSFGDLPEYTQGTTGIFQTSFNAQTSNLITTGKTDKSDVEAEGPQSLVSTGKTPLTSAPSTGTICTTRPDGSAPHTSSAKENTLPVTTKKPSEPCTSVSNTTSRQTTPSVSTDAHTSSLKTQSTSKPAQVSTTVKTTVLTTTEIITQTSTAQTQQPVTSASDKRTPVTEEIRGVWVATVYRIDFPSGSKLSSKQLKNEVRELVDSLAEYGFNAVYFQVRPTSDALYKSDIFPSSHWITGEQGADFPDDFDILEYLVEYAHSKDVAVHAWINPYRVTNSASMKLSKNNPASLHPEWTFEINGLKYYNPGLPEVTELIVSGVSEIVENYDVDGIIFDDYFYPGEDELHNSDPSKDIDYRTYLEYGRDFDDIGDWRRDNINKMIECTFERIKAVDKDCLFGVAPAGIWNNKSDEFPNGSDTGGRQAYQQIFCDALAWANGKYVDYISPQIYWSTENKTAPFKTLALWWQEALKDSQTKLIISYNVYSLDPSQTKIQVDFARQTDNYYGYIFYNYNNIYSSAERLEIITELGAFNFKKEE